MAIKVYSSYQEFSYEEKEIVEYLEDQDYPSDNFVDEDDLWDDPSKDLQGLNANNDSIKDDASFYIVCDDEDEETAEDIAELLGKYSKTFIENYHKMFFSII